MNPPGLDLGPFDIFYLNALGVVIANGPTNVPKSALLPPSGYTITNVPDTAIKIRVKSKSSLCSDFKVDKTIPNTPGTIPVITTTAPPVVPTTTTPVVPPATTTTVVPPATTTTAIPPTTTTTVVPATTTTFVPTTTSALILCRCYTLANTDPFGFPNRSYTFLNCDGNSETGSIAADSTKEFCAAQGSILGQGFTIVGNTPCFGFCGVTNTTTGTIITTLPPVTTTTSAATAITTYNLCFSIETCDPNSPSSACGCPPSLQSPFYSSCSTLSVGCILYTNIALTLPVQAGFYSNGVTCNTVNSAGQITAIGPCPEITTTTSTTDPNVITFTNICCANVENGPCSLIQVQSGQTCFDVEKFPCVFPNIPCTTTTSP